MFRPSTLDSGSSDRYVDCKLGDSDPGYLWVTYNAMKNTYGVLCYQEQLAQIAREVGGFSLGEGVKLVKLISKKKVDKILALRDKFMAGANQNGCPKEDAEAIWHMFEAVSYTHLVRKAKYLGQTALGICDYNTMAATLILQKECEAAGLNWVFGYSLTFTDGINKIDAKIYCQTQDRCV